MFDRARFLATLHIVAKESAHLEWSRQRLFSQPITPAWVDGLDTQPEPAERLEVFVSRYDRLQDTIADKLLPRWLRALAERPRSQIEVLNRAEQLGVLEDASQWLEARQLRNSLIHEYMENSTAFAENIQLVEHYSHCCLKPISACAMMPPRAWASPRMNCCNTAVLRGIGSGLAL